MQKIKENLVWLKPTDKMHSYLLRFHQPWLMILQQRDTESYFGIEICKTPLK